jgi:ABC-type phosphate transport system substrate-binding protein
LTGLPLVSERPLKEIRRRRAVLQYWQRQLLSPTGGARLPTVKGSDAEVLVYVAKTKGAVGYVSAGAALSSDVKAVSVVD